MNRPMLMTRTLTCVAVSVLFVTLAVLAVAWMISIPFYGDNSHDLNILRTTFFNEVSFYSTTSGSSSAPFKQYASDGIPLVSYNSHTGVVHPVGIAQRMLRYYGPGFLGRIEERHTFKRILVDIVNSAVLNGADGKLEYSIPFTAGTYHYKFKPGWGSAMAQGVMLSVLARGYISYPQLRESVYSYGLSLIHPLTVAADDGGLKYIVHVGGHQFPFYEEYPSKPLPPLTLNGFMFTLIGLHEFHAVTGSELAAKLFREGLQTLVYILPYYNTFPISTYDLSYLTFRGVKPNMAPRYNEVHIKQLDYFYDITGEKLFACVSNALRRKRGLIEDYYGTSYTELSPEDLSQLRWHTPLHWDDSCKEHFSETSEVYAEQRISVQ